jgi:malto-oligosyltrehalose trehalohydrolase
MVFLDVVYNHFGPEGNYLHAYAPDFFTRRHRTPWGSAINFGGKNSRAVRDFFIHNALYWSHEYHIDGLRLDAAHAIHDESSPHILEEIAETVRASLPANRHVHLVLENDANQTRHLARDAAGHPRHYAAQWNDDVHHALHVLLTGETGGYYGDYAEAPVRHFGRALAEGFAYQGEPSPFRRGRERGEPSAHLPPGAFIGFLQNHDQVGNRAYGERIEALADSAAVEAALGILLLAPPPPLVFMGEEWAAPQPFPFFCDFEPDLARRVRTGRLREFSQFEQFRDPRARGRIPDPTAAATFRSAVLNWADPEISPHRERLALVRRLFALRHRAIMPRLSGMHKGADGYGTFGQGGLTVTWRLGEGSRLHVLANLSGAAANEALPVLPGEVLFETERPGERRRRGRLPAWWVLWTLED